MARIKSYRDSAVQFVNHFATHAQNTADVGGGATIITVTVVVVVATAAAAAAAVRVYTRHESRSSHKTLHNRLHLMGLIRSFFYGYTKLTYHVINV